MPIALPDNATLNAFAIIVDINNFTRMVTDAVRGSTQGKFVAQFTAEALDGVIRAIEAHDGEVMAVMGDAVFGIIPEDSSICGACEEIAAGVNRKCRCISEHQIHAPDDWHYAPGGLSMKIAIEFGSMSVTTIHSHQTGTQRLIVSRAVNYASRISQGGKGNRCLLGPVAASMPGFSSRPLRGPIPLEESKADGESYIYYELPMGELWAEGALGRDRLSYVA